MQRRSFWAVLSGMGSAFGIKRPEDAHSRFRINFQGLMQWGDGNLPWNKAFGPVEIRDRSGALERVLFEFNGPRGVPVGLTLVDMSHGENNVISVTAENGDLIFRNESVGNVIFTIKGDGSGAS